MTEAPFLLPRVLLTVLAVSTGTAERLDGLAAWSSSAQGRVEESSSALDRKVGNRLLQAVTSIACLLEEYGAAAKWLIYTVRSNFLC